MTSWVLATDNSALVTSAEEDSQFLLKVFAKWYTWASLIIKVSKCKTFDIKDYRSKSIQFKPYLWTNNELIPPVKINESFSYLGKENSIDIKPDKIKETLLKDLNQFMKLIDRLLLHPKNKIMIAHVMFTVNVGGLYQYMRYLKLWQSKILTWSGKHMLKRATFTQGCTS